jgi:hypothetical protein
VNASHVEVALGTIWKLSVASDLFSAFGVPFLGSTFAGSD